MNNARYEELREIRWRRKLTTAESAELRSWLAAHPELQADWAAEMALSGALGRLPASPVASNFTSRVMQTVQRETAGTWLRESRWDWLWHPFLPRVTTAALAFCLGLLVTIGSKPKELRRKAESVAAVAEVASLPSPDILQDFETVRQLNVAPPPDTELLALLQ